MAATEALVFDGVRTPRGKGKSNGSLHATKPVDLVVGLMHELLARHGSLDPNRIDDVVLGPVYADRRPGRRHRQDRRDQGRSSEHRRRCSAQPLLRLGPRGGQHRRPEGRLRLGGPRLRRRRRVDVTRADGLRRRCLGDGPGDQLRHELHPPGCRRGPDRDDRGLQPRRRRRLRRPLAGACRDCAGRGSPGSRRWPTPSPNSPTPPRPTGSPASSCSTRRAPPGDRRRCSATSRTFDPETWVELVQRQPDPLRHRARRRRGAPRDVADVPHVAAVVRLLLAPLRAHRRADGASGMPSARSS